LRCQHVKVNEPVCAEFVGEATRRRERLQGSSGIFEHEGKGRDLILGSARIEFKQHGRGTTLEGADRAQERTEKCDLDGYGRLPASLIE
jgi:hypothetical protein